MDADRGRHECGGVDNQTGEPWRKIKSWFGYELHVVTDTRCEFPLVVEVIKASVCKLKLLEKILP